MYKNNRKAITNSLKRRNMGSTSCSLLFVLFPLILVVASEARTIEDVWTRIHRRNLNDRKVVDVAKFAVSEHNKNVSIHLHFVSVIYGETRRNVRYEKFRLMILTKEGHIADRSKNYDVDVWIVKKNNRFSLESFKQSHGIEI